jgi:hypothetical protein
MQKIMAVTDLKGTLLGVVRADPIDIGNGKTIRAVPPPPARYRHHMLDVADDFLRRPASEVHDKIRRLIVTSRP